MVIWKFELVLEDGQGVGMPQGAQLLHVAEQNGVLCLWAIVDPDAPNVIRHITIRGTGHPCGPECNVVSHIGTVMTPPFVWHVFDLGEQ